MPEKLGEITLTKADLDEAQKVLAAGCTGQVTIVFSDTRMVGGVRSMSEGFAIEPKTVHCLYGCKKEEDIKAALQSQKGIVRVNC